MTTPRIYLDHNASSPLRPEARAAMIAALELAGNPSSIHSEGRSARAVIEDARAEVAALAGGKPADVVFTSGGSEAANTVIRSGFDLILRAGVEHDCVREAASVSGARIVELPVDRDGIVALKSVETALDSFKSGRSRVLLCLQLANNETGVIQPIAAIAAVAKARGVTVFVDAVQAAGKIPMVFMDLGADAIALSAHKFGGPKGVGAVVVRPDWAVAPLVRGGGQEGRRRAGTENVVGIAGFGAAARAARGAIGQMAGLAALRDRLEREVMVLTPSVEVIGAGVSRLPNTSCLVKPGASAETQVIRFDLAGIALSSGAACSSGKVGKSPVLSAMGRTGQAGEAIRVSLGWTTTEDDITRFAAAWTMIHASAAARSVA